MADFDPDAYLGGTTDTEVADPSQGFDPNAYLSLGATSSTAASFDPDQYLAAQRAPTPSAISPWQDAAMRFVNAAGGTVEKATEGMLRIAGESPFSPAYLIPRSEIDRVANAMHQTNEAVQNDARRINPNLANSTPAKIATAAGDVFGTVPAAMAAGAAALPLLATAGASGAYAEAYDKSRADGKDDTEARREGVLAAVKTAPELGGYLVAGKLGSMAAAKVLGEAASPLLKGMAATAAALPANMAASAAIRAFEGQPVAPDAGSLTTDALFALMHGAGEYTAAREPSGKVGLADVQVPQEEVGSVTSAPSETQTAARPAEIPFMEDTGIAFMTRSRYADELRARGVSDEVIARVTGSEMDELMKQPVAHTSEPILTPPEPSTETTEEPTASTQPSATSADLRPLRSGVGEDASLQQQGEIAQPRETEDQPAAQAAPVDEQRPYWNQTVAPDGGYSDHPLVRFVIDDIGGVLSKSAARSELTDFEANKSLWDDAPSFPDPRQNKIYNNRTGQTPDAVATAAAEAGLLPPGATPTDLWRALQQTADSSHSIARQERAFRNEMARAHAEATAEAARTPVMSQSVKLRMKAGASEGGFVNADLLQGAADIGRRVYKAGQNFVQWAAHMVRQLGDRIRPHLETLWNSITGQNVLPFARERGSVLIPSRSSFDESANDGQKIRGHIETVKRMVEVSPTVKEKVESWMSPTYVPEVNARAQAAIDQMGLDRAYERVLTLKPATSEDLAFVRHTALRLDQLASATGDEAAKTTLFDKAATARNKMAESLTAPAQMLQYITTIGKTSPEGLVREAQKIVTAAVASDPEKVKLVEQIERLKAQLANLKPGMVKPVTELTLRSLSKVDKRGERISAATLNDLLTKNRAGKLTPADFEAALKKNFGIPQLTPANIAKIRAAQKLWEQTQDPLVKMRRAGEMMDAVYSLVPRNTLSKVRAAAVISMILHGKLPIRIFASDSLNLIGQTAVDAIKNIPRDTGNVFTGQRTITAAQLRGIVSGFGAPFETFRAGYDDAKMRGLTTIPSMKEGMRTLLDITSMTTRGIFDLQDIKAVNRHVFSSRFGKLAEDAVTTLHNVVPYAFWNAAYRSSMARQMRLARIDTPTDEIIQRARIDASRAIFMNDTLANDALMGMRKIMNLGAKQYGIGTATIPFARIPGAIVTEGATWTPIGYVRAIYKAVRPGVEGREKAVIDSLIKASIGTAGAVSSGFWLARLGVITGAPEENKELEALRKATGWGAYRVNVSELLRRTMSMDWTSQSAQPQTGDLIVNYNWLEPLAFGVAMGADMAHSQSKREIDLKRGKITAGAVGTAVEAGIKSIVDLPLLQGIERLSRSIGEGRPIDAAVGAIANVPGNFVPALVRQTSQYIDNTEREGGGGGVVEQQVARLAQEIPWLSQKYPARYDVLGQATQRYNYGNNSLLNVFLNPALPSRFTGNPQTAELLKLFTDTGDSKVLPGQVQHTITVNKQQVQLDNMQLATYQRYVGALSAAALTHLIASPSFAEEPDTIKASRLSEALAAAHTAAKIDLFGQKVYSVGAKGSVSIASPNAFAAMQGARAAGLNTPAPTGAMATTTTTPTPQPTATPPMTAANAPEGAYLHKGPQWYRKINGQWQPSPEPIAR